MTVDARPSRPMTLREKLVAAMVVEYCLASVLIAFFASDTGTVLFFLTASPSVVVAFVGLEPGVFDRRLKIDKTGKEY